MKMNMNTAKQYEICRKAQKIAVYNLAKEKLKQAKQSGDTEKIRIARHNIDMLMTNV
jgi:hypothetical protein